MKKSMWFAMGLILWGVLYLMLYSRSVQSAYGKQYQVEEEKDVCSFANGLQFQIDHDEFWKIKKVHAVLPEEEKMKAWVEKVTKVAWDESKKKKYSGGGFRYEDEKNGIVINYGGENGTYFFENFKNESSEIIRDNLAELRILLGQYLQELGYQAEETSLKMDDESCPTEYTFTYRTVADGITVESGNYDVNGEAVANNGIEIKYSSKGIVYLSAFGIQFDEEEPLEADAQLEDHVKKAVEEWVLLHDGIRDWKEYSVTGVEFVFLPTLRKTGWSRQLQLVPALRLDVKWISYEYRNKQCTEHAGYFLYDIGEGEIITCF